MRSVKWTLTVQGGKKLHARGPMGLEELTCSKWIVFGQGHIRE